MRIVVFMLLVLARPGAADLPPGLTHEEAACQNVFGPTTDAVGAAIALCVVRCDAKAARGKIPPSSCRPPYGTATQACIDAARGDGERRIARGCADDCPECYQGGDCRTYGHNALLVTAQVVDGLVRPILCDDSTSTDGLSPAEGRCRRTTGVVLARAARAFGACFVRCRRQQERGDSTFLGVGLCTSSVLQTRAVLRCLTRARNRATAAIERRCGNPPDCLPDPTALVAVVEEQIRSDYAVLIFCASPSGAFLDGDGDARGFR